MPNWCSNNLTVRGNYEQVSKFVEDVRDDEEGFRLAQLVPCPQELKDTMSGFYSEEEKQKALVEQQKRNLKKYGHKDWYDWEYANWGTKWGDCETDFVSGEVIKAENDQYSNCAFVFQSAWGPCTQLVIHISKLYPELWFGGTYEETGMMFAGCYVVHNGELLLDECADIEVPDSVTKAMEEDDDYEPFHDMLADIAGDYEYKVEEVMFA